MEERNKFKMARQHPASAGFTWGYFVLVLGFLGFGLRAPLMLGVAAFMLAVAGGVWCWFRPSWFFADEAGLVIRWPWRQRNIPMHSILSVDYLDYKALGFTLRVGGAGGLWGAFGRFYSFKMGMLDCYLSSNRGILLLRLEGQKPLLISPERPEAFLNLFKNTRGHKKRVAILASGSGSNLQALLDAMKDLSYPAKAVLVLSNKEQAFALERARKAGVAASFVDPKKFDGKEAYDQELVRLLREAEVELVCLAGYMRILTPVFVEAFSGRILNIHPSLLPKFGGAGMYGHHVHEAVLKAGEASSGATVHYVTSGVDEGAVILQDSLSVLPQDSAESLAKRVLEVEHRIYPEALRKVCESL